MCQRRGLFALLVAVDDVHSGGALRELFSRWLAGRVCIGVVGFPKPRRLEGKKEKKKKINGSASNPGI